LLLERRINWFCCINSPFWIWLLIADSCNQPGKQEFDDLNVLVSIWIIGEFTMNPIAVSTANPRERRYQLDKSNQYLASTHLQITSNSISCKQSRKCRCSQQSIGLTSKITNNHHCQTFKEWQK
jgi:hypothetical protein